MAARKRQHSGSYANYPKKEGFSLAGVLLAAIGYERDRLIVRLLAETGCTPKELVNIKAGDVSADSLRIRAENTKNKRERLVPISRALSLDLRNYAKGRTFVFCSRNNEILTTRSIRKILSKYSALADVKISARDLRNSFIQDSIKEKRPFEDIKLTAGIKRLDQKRFLNNEEIAGIKRIIESKRDRLILDVLLETGCTLEELTSIKIKDISADQIKIKARIATISSKLSLRVKDFAAGNRAADFLFSTRQSSAISGKRVFQIIRANAKKAGISVNPQMLRYSHIVLALSAGKSIEEVSRQTGIRNLGRLHLYGSLGVKS